MTENDTDLATRTRDWIDHDPDPSDRQELNRLLEAGQWALLRDRMGGTLEFGTAGIRGAVEAGSNRMNRAVVVRTTAGLSNFLHASRSGPVVVGFDGRTSSRQFASDTVGVLAAAGHDVHYFAEPVPTPLVAYASLQFGAAAAIVITASHNPPADNGYKVYDENGAQIVPPVDTEIAAAIADVGPARAVPRVEDALEAPTASIHRIDEEAVYAAYRAEVDGVRPRTGGSDLKVAYTPIHGVGWRFVRRLVTDAGHHGIRVVETQRDPDGRFPTVSFPNPEEPGAMDLAIQLGNEIGADLVIANDPDADRLAVVLPDAESGWRPLSGNQVGVLLADWLLEAWAEDERPIVINSIVSSPMLATVASLHGAHFEQTLTGFKWIANAALDLEAEGKGRFVFGYEEALGYSVGPVVRDKDGMSAALLFVDMAAGLAETGMTVQDRLIDLYRRAGLWVSAQHSVTKAGSEGLAEISAAMERLGSDVPTSLGTRDIVEVTDYRTGADQRPRWLAETPLVALRLTGDARVLIRPSGTEPKLKIYVDLPGKPEGDLVANEASLMEEAKAMAAEAATFIGL